MPNANQYSRGQIKSDSWRPPCGPERLGIQVGHRDSPLPIGVHRTEYSVCSSVTSSVRPAAIDRRPPLADALDLHREYQTDQENSRKQFVEIASGEDDVVFEPEGPASSHAEPDLRAPRYLVPQTPGDNRLEFVERRAEKPCSSDGDHPRSGWSCFTNDGGTPDG
jgi:hypothetical protein